MVLSWVWVWVRVRVRVSANQCRVVGRRALEQEDDVLREVLDAHLVRASVDARVGAGVGVGVRVRVRVRVGP